MAARNPGWSAGVKERNTSENPMEGNGRRKDDCDETNGVDGGLALDSRWTESDTGNDEVVRQSCPTSSYGNSSADPPSRSVPEAIHAQMSQLHSVRPRCSSQRRARAWMCGKDGERLRTSVGRTDGAGRLTTGRCGLFGQEEHRGV